MQKHSKQIRQFGKREIVSQIRERQSEQAAAEFAQYDSSYANYLWQLNQAIENEMEEEWKKFDEMHQDDEMQQYDDFFDDFYLDDCLAINGE